MTFERIIPHNDKIRITVLNGCVTIQQTDHTKTEPDVVSIDPAYVEQLIGYLRETVAMLNGDVATRATPQPIRPPLTSTLFGKT